MATKNGQMMSAIKKAKAPKLDVRLELYRQMQACRGMEQRAYDLFMQNLIKGTSHLALGQEAISAAFGVAMRDDDYTFCTYRGHNHTLVRGVSMTSILGELMGRECGLLHGKGGSMHIADIDKGMLGANGIVGAGAPIAVGAAMSAKLDGRGKVSVAFSGDGACNQGTTFEAMNMAVVTKAPAIFVFENNKYSENTGVEYAVGTASDIAGRAEGFGMKVWRADGTDFFDVYNTMLDLLGHVRAGNGPAAIECDTERYFGHFEGDPQRYRGEGELDRIREHRDPLKKFREAASSLDKISIDDLDNIDAEIAKLIDQAVDEARQAPPPKPEDVLTDVYVSY